jgi:aromatic-L-amino-acid decarboxylase
MPDMDQATIDDQFEEAAGRAVRRMSLCTPDSYDEESYLRNSMVLTHLYQLANIEVIPSACESMKSATEPTSEPTPELSPIPMTLDPSDWPSARAEAHKMLDISLDFLEKARDRPAWIPLPTQVRRRLLCEALPEHGKPIAEVCQDMVDDVLPYSGGNTHPRFWGWVHGSGTVGGVIAEMMAAAMNSNVGLCSHSGVLIERQVIEWMRQLFEFPAETGGGVIVSGTSMAAVICLAAARYHALNTVRQEGLVSLGARLVAYASTQTHVCVAKALELLGLGIQALRLVPVDNEYRMDVQALKNMIEEDRQQGFTPFCIVGNAGMFKECTWIEVKLSRVGEGVI